MISALTELRHGRISILVRTGTVHRKTRPLEFAFCALAAIALLGELTLTAGRVLLFGATGLPIDCALRGTGDPPVPLTGPTRNGGLAARLPAPGHPGKLPASRRRTATPGGRPQTRQGTSPGD